MRLELKEKCNLLADNRDKVAKNFVWEPANMYYIPALYYSMADRTVNIDAMTDCQKILAKNEGLFSNFRMHLNTTVMCRMAMSKKPEKYLQILQDTYAELKSYHFSSTEQLVLAAMQFCDITNKSVRLSRISRMKNIYKQCDKLHPFLTTQEDLILLSQVAASKRYMAALLEDIEECLKLLKPVFPGHANAMQSVAFVLALSSKPAYDKCAAFVQLYRELEVLGMPLDKGQELAVIAAVSLLNADPVALAIDISDAEEYLSERNGFGALTSGGSVRVMYAALLTAESYYNETESEQTLEELNNIMMAIASEIALEAAIAATAAACAAT